MITDRIIVNVLAAGLLADEGAALSGVLSGFE